MRGEAVKPGEAAAARAVHPLPTEERRCLFCGEVLVRKRRRYWKSLLRRVAGDLEQRRDFAKRKYCGPRCATAVLALVGGGAHPFGLTFDSVISGVTGRSLSCVRQSRQRLAIKAPPAWQKQNAAGRWRAAIKAWGATRMRAWFDAFGKGPEAGKFRAEFELVVSQLADSGQLPDLPK